MGGVCLVFSFSFFIVVHGVFGSGLVFWGGVFVSLFWFCIWGLKPAAS